MALVLHVATIGSVKHGIMQPDDYAAISAQTGIRKATDNETLDDSTEITALRTSGKIVKLSCRLKNGRTNTVLCTTEKVSGAIAGLRGKALAGSTISSATIPQKRSRR
jgi:hypothetical protein